MNWRSFLLKHIADLKEEIKTTTEFGFLNDPSQVLWQSENISHLMYIYTPDHYYMDYDCYDSEENILNIPGFLDNILTSKPSLKVLTKKIDRVSEEIIWRLFKDTYQNTGKYKMQPFLTRSARLLMTAFQRVQNNKQGTMNTKSRSKVKVKVANKVTAKPTLKTRVVTRAKKAAKTAVVRKVSRRLTQNVKNIALNQLQNNPALASLLSGPLGNIAVPALLAVGLEMLPLPEQIREQIATVKDALVEELTVQALDEGTAPLEELVIMLLPAIKDVIPMLTSGNSIPQLAEKASV